MKEEKGLKKRVAQLDKRYAVLKQELSEILKEGAEIQRGISEAIDKKKMAAILHTIKKQS